LPAADDTAEDSSGVRAVVLSRPKWKFIDGIRDEALARLKRSIGILEMAIAVVEQRTGFAEIQIAITNVVEVLGQRVLRLKGNAVSQLPFNGKI
jgi:hypothetical protein